MTKAPEFVQKGLATISSWLPKKAAPSTTLVVVLVSTIPLAMLLRGVLTYLNVYLMTWVAIRAINDLRTRLFSHLLGLSLGFFNRTSTGELITHLNNSAVIQKHDLHVVHDDYSGAYRDSFAAGPAGLPAAEADAHLDAGVSGVHHSGGRLRPEGPQIGNGVPSRIDQADRPDVREFHGLPRRQGLQPGGDPGRPVPDPLARVHQPLHADAPGHGNPGPDDRVCRVGGCGAVHSVHCAGDQADPRGFSPVPRERVFDVRPDQGPDPGCTTSSTSPGLSATGSSSSWRRPPRCPNRPGRARWQPRRRRSSSSMWTSTTGTSRCCGM